MHLSEGVDVFVYGFCHFSINFISVYVWQWCLAGVVLQKIWRCPWYFHCFCWSYFPPLNFISDRRHFVLQQSWYFRLHKPLACCSISMCGHRQLMHCINELLNWQYEHLDHKWATKTNLTLRIYIFISRQVHGNRLLIQWWALSTHIETERIKAKTFLAIFKEHLRGLPCDCKAS